MALRKARDILAKMEERYRVLLLQAMAQASVWVVGVFPLYPTTSLSAAPAPRAEVLFGYFDRELAIGAFPPLPIGSLSALRSPGTWMAAGLLPEIATPITMIELAWVM
jgi:hypothetical protein